MTISPRFLDEIRNRLTLSDIIGRKVKVIRAGREFKACCPFHSEKTPSFTINDQKQFYHCFGCGAHGDVLKFTMEHDNLGFRDAVEVLAAEAGLEVPKEDPRAIEKAQKAKDLHDLMADAAGWFTDQLYQSQNRDVQDYLNQREITPELVNDFTVGYAPDDSKALITYIRGKGYSQQDMVDVGLIRISTKGAKEPYAFFRDRVVFPVADRRGRIIAFGGRILPEHIRPPTQSSFTPPKYLNSSDTILFDKGRSLYGEDKARLAARDNKPVIVTEGYMDVIACHAAGFSGAVAPMGTALTEGQIQSLWTMIPDEHKEPILCFDGDNAGRKAAARVCERIMPLLKAGHSIRLAFMPDGEDPDSLIKSGGPAKFKAILDNAISLIDYIWMSKTGGRTFKTPEERAGVIQSIRNEITSIEDDEVQRHYRALIDQRISDHFFSHYNDRNNGRGKGNNNRGGGPKPKRPSTIRPKVPSFSSTYERVLIAALLNHPIIFDHIEEQLSALSCQQKYLENIKASALQILSNDPDCPAEKLQSDLYYEGFEKEVRDILHEKTYVHAAFAAPISDSQDVDAQEIVGKWLEIWQSIQDQQSKNERATDWKQAMQKQDEATEAKLRQQADQRKSG